MKEKRAKGLPVYPGSISNYIILSILIIIEAVTVIGQAYFLAQAITGLFERRPVLDLLTEMVLFFAAFSLRHFIVQLQSKLSSNFALKTSEDLRNRLFHTYFKRSSSISQKKGTGHLVTLAMEGIDDVGLYLEIIGIRTIKSFILPFAIVFYIFQFDRSSAYILVATVPIVIIFMILLGLAAEKLADRQYTSYTRLSNHFVDSLKGLETLMFLGKSKAHAKKIQLVSEEYRKAAMRTLRVAFLSSFALDFFSSLSIAFVAVGLGFRLIDGTVLLLPALTILILAPEYFSPIKDVGKDYHATLDGQLAMQEINALLEEGRTSEALLEATSQEVNDVQSIELNDIDVKIDEHLVLKELNFLAEKGMIGIIGASGSGKSTLIHLLAGRLPSTAGEIKINNELVKTLHSESWFEQIAYIPQHPYIFPLSLADNIRFYAPETPDEKVKELVREIGLASLLETLPNGIHEKIGEGNRSLSGGQEQRVAMARALLSNKPIVLLDEPTAHLDIVTEYEIKQLILKLFNDKFVFIATHRLHWMAHMDKILLLNEGQLVAEGTHNHLIADSDLYGKLMNKKEGRGNE